MKAEFRIVVWLGVAVSLCVLTAPKFPALLGSALGDTFGTVFPAFPFAALLILIMGLRWREFRGVVAAERGIGSELGVRLLGASILVILGLGEPVTGLSVEAAGVSFVLTFYASSLVINPLTKRFLLPYATICAVGVGVPFLLQLAFGEPLAVASSTLSSRFVDLLGFPVAWQGTQFQFTSETGDIISGVVTPGCSSVISVTTFLGLLALMHLDLEKDLRSTLSLASVGVAVLVLLNAVRIMILMWVGYNDGAGAFWGVHNWIGYALFLGFYLTALPIYAGMGRRDSPKGPSAGLRRPRRTQVLP